MNHIVRIFFLFLTYFLQHSQYDRYTILQIVCLDINVAGVSNLSNSIRDSSNKMSNISVYLLLSLFSAMVSY